jgi:predicted enzyme related to lactoylglutathione lyase
MGERTSYAPGTFSWVDLATTDADAAKRFYTNLFGWEAEEMPAGDAGTYTMFRLNGSWVAALYQQPDEQRARGVPPNWVSYVTVADVEDAAADAQELGGAVIAEPFDVDDAGRMAVVADPTGAVLALWEPRTHIGAERVNDPGCFTWNDLATSDMETAQEFYTELFGWEAEQLDTNGRPPYTVWRNNGRTNGGMRPLAPQDGAPPHWLVYFTVDDVDDAVRRVDELGGEIVVEPFTVPAGRFAVLRDPQGAYFAIYEGDVDD